MARRANNPVLVMVVQQIKPEYWTHAAATPSLASLLAEAHTANDLPASDPSRVGRLQGIADAIGSYVVGQWEADDREVEDAHAILHGDDTQQMWDEAAGEYCTVSKYLPICS